MLNVMKKILFILAVAMLSLSLFSCKEDELKGDSIFIDRETELSPLDIWLEDNIRGPYNMSFKYKFEDIESNLTYNLIPAREDKSGQMAMLVKHLWLDVYTEAAGIDFVRKYIPKSIFLLGSSAYQSETRILGTAESGMKIVLYNINNLNAYDVAALSDSYFRTMHHEFAHILHQQRNYDQTFGLISAEHYLASAWHNRGADAAAKLGFVSPYAGSQPNEDFVENIARYLVYNDAWWASLHSMAGTEGSEIINRKQAMVKEYMLEKWGIDLEHLRAIVRRRQTEVANLTFNNY